MLVFVKKAHLIKKSGSGLNFHLEMARLGVDVEDQKPQLGWCNNKITFTFGRFCIKFRSRIVRVCCQLRLCLRSDAYFLADIRHEAGT